MSDNRTANPTTDGPDITPPVTDFTAQILIWGYACSGNNEVGCLVAEDQEWVRLSFAYWDRDQAYLDSVERWHGTVRLPTPWWWALPGATDLVLLRQKRMAEWSAA